MNKFVCAITGAAALAVGAAFAADPLTLQDGDDVVYGAETVDVGGVSFPKKAGGYATARLTLNGTTFSCTGLSASNNDGHGMYADLVVTNGATMTVNGDIWYGTSSYGNNCRERIFVRDSTITFNPKNYQQFGHGAYQMNKGLFELSGTNAQLLFPKSTDLVIAGHCNVLLTNTTMSVAGATKIGAVTSTAAGSSVYGFTNQLQFVSGAASFKSFETAVGLPAEILISGGTFVVTNGFTVGGGISLTPALKPFCVTLTVTNAAQLTVGGALNLAYGTVNTTTLDVSDDATVTLGSLKVGDYGTGVVHSAGATITASAGVTLGAQASASGTYELGDGTLVTKSVSGGAGTSVFAADGGTIRLTADGGSLFGGLGTLTIGPKGLTVDTAGHTVTIARSFTGGKVTFTGGGTVTIASGVTMGDFDSDSSTKVIWVDEGTTETISQASGATTRTEPLQKNGNDTLVFDIADGAAYTLDATLRTGTMDKQGGGLLTLKQDAKLFGDLYLTGGTLETGVNGPKTLGTTLSLTNAATSPLVVVKNDADLTLKFPATVDAFKQPLVKRGVGDLTLVRDPGWLKYEPKGATQTDPAGFRNKPALDFGDGTSVPTNNYAHITVPEGRLTLKAGSASAFEINWATVAVGTPAVSCAKQPEFWLDNVNVRSLSIVLGAGAIADSSAITAPKLVYTNAFQDGGSVKIGTWATNPAFRPELRAYHSTLAVGTFEPAGGYQQPASGTFMFGRFEAGSQLFVSANNRTEFRGPLRLEFDNSEFGCRILEHERKVHPTDGTISIYYWATVSTNTLVFANGSTFYSKGVASAEATGARVVPRQTFVFDDSTIDPQETGDFTWNFDDLINSYFEMRGKGLVMKPTAGQTFTMAEPLHGEGGFVNRGAGTTVLKDGVVQYTGVTCAEQGTIDFNGATVTNVTLAGEGAFANGTLVTPKVLADGSAPQLDGVTLDGKVTVVFGDTAPAVGTTVDVARYSGSIANWKVRRNRDFGAILSKDGDVVKATVTAPSGFVITVK